MILSIFLHGKQFHIASDTQMKIYHIDNQYTISDCIVPFIHDFLKNESNNIETVFFPSGPSSFTSIRIINAIVKGLCISNQNIKHIGISNFLTYIYTKNLPSGRVSIPTFRGDFFVADYTNWKITRDYLADCSEMLDFDGHNLAFNQIHVINSTVGIQNQAFVTNSFDINYGFTPTFRF